MNNKEKAWMLMGQRVSAYKNYSDRKDWSRPKIHEARTLLQAEYKTHATEWASDPEIVNIVKEQLANCLTEAH